MSVLLGDCFVQNMLIMEIVISARMGLICSVETVFRVL